MTQTFGGSMGAALLAALMFSTSGCSGSDDAEPVESSMTGAAESPIAGEEGNDQVHVEQTTAPAAEQDEVHAAQRFLVTWSRPDLGYEEWWADLEPLLSPQGQQDYAGTDPANVPALELSGTPRVEESTVATATTVWQPTTVGTFGVRMSRTSQTAAWRVAELHFPEGIH